jgi:MFS family permease
LHAYVAFQSRDYRFLAAANTLSGLGMQMLSVAVSWDLYQTTHSALVLGNVGLVQVAPFFLFALFAGHLADRYNRRSIILITQCLFVVASLALLFGTRSVALIYSCLFFTATARSFQGPARLSILSNVVSAEHIGNAVTWNSSMQELASVTGPAIAGVLLAAQGSRAVYLIQAVCAVCVLLSYALMRFRPAPVTSKTTIAEAIRFLFNDKLILSVASLDMFAVLFGGATALLPIYAVEILGGGVHTLGWLRAAPPVGAVLMALTLAHRPRIKRAGMVLLWAVAGYGIATIAFGLSRTIWFSFLMLAVTGAFDNVSVVLRQSLVQGETPDWVRGRVLAVNNIFISSSNQLGAVESGLTAQWFGPIGSVAGGGVATILVVTGYALLAKRLREWRQ